MGSPRDVLAAPSSLAPGFKVEEMQLLAVLRAIGHVTKPIVFRDPMFVQVLGRLGIEQRMVEEAGQRAMGYSPTDIEEACRRLERSLAE